MKTILLCCLLFFSTSIWAADESDRVVIKISNDTGSDCILKKQAVINGKISDAITFQKEIFRDQTITFSMNSKGKGTRRKAIVDVGSTLSHKVTMPEILFFISK